MARLSIAILSSDRFDLLSATIHSLLSTVTYPINEIIIYNHSESIGKGWNELIRRVKGDYILMCQDDWYFIEKWDWVKNAIEILNDKDIGIVRLRKEGDGQVEEKVINIFENGCIVDCIGGGFSMNPFICRKELLETLGEVKSIEKQKGIAEIELRENYKKLGFKTAKLINKAKGVCIHIGRGRRKEI